MTVKQKIQISLFGNKMFEAYKLDTFLSAFTDGVPHFTGIDSNISKWETSRIEQKLINDKFLNAHYNDLIITADGKLHLAKGGYMFQVQQALLLPVSFWLSILAAIISIISFIRSFY